MCAMRVYELQAMGVGIMSNYARSVFNTFPDIRLVPYSGNLSFDFSREETFDQYKAKIRRLRTVMTDRTAYSVTARLLRNAGIEFPLCDEPRVAIICHALDQDRIQQAYSQTYSFCEVICNFDDASEEDWKKNCFDNDIQYFTWFDNNYDYGPNYIRDMINAFKYTDVAFVTKHAWFSTDGFVDGPQHEFTSTISSRGRTVFSTRSYSPFQLNTIVSHEGVKADNLIGYALDPFEIKSASGDLAYRQKPAVEYILSIIVPVFNNGRFLISKCMDSLIRNRNWEKFQVIIVDDGSTDKDTIEIVKNIDQAHDNVVIHCFQDGGSGTASRARNFGIGLAEAPLISFLDPDNEISSGGYDELISIYEELASEDMQVDFVAGYHVKVEAKSTVIGKHAACRCLKIEDLKEHFLVSGKFPVVPTQPTVIRRRLFNERSLRFIEGAAGQDTLFGWELLCHSRAGVFTDAAHLIYYAQRSGSIVNLVDESYFQKKLILERAQVEFLKREGLFRVYKEVVHKRFRDGWYLPKMSKIGDPGMKARCELILREIDNLYNDDVSILLV
jgi:glycosyltransferase involved in cell wall biosynthesis